MALIKKIDVEKYFADRRALRRGRIAPTSQPDATRTKPAGRAAKAAGPVRNPTLEQSSASASPASIPIVHDSGQSSLLRPPGSWQE
jgi:lactam utilization protein B